MNLSTHFTLEEATTSQEAARKGIDNFSPSDEIVEAAKNTAFRMELVRQVLNTPINVNSWIRCLELNRALGSKDSSQHIKGEAVDFIAPAFGTPTEICLELEKSRDLIRWDQLILEHSWVHISWNSVPSSIQRGETLSLLSSGQYAIGLTQADGTIIS